MKALSTLFVAGVTAFTGATASAEVVIDVFFTPLSETEWEVSAAVVDGAELTSGISAFSISVFADDLAGISFAPNVLSTLTASGTVGFGAISQGIIGADLFFNAGAFQDDAATDILDIGETPVFVESLLEASFPSVDLGVPAVLGVLTTPAGLGEGNFVADDFGLFNADATGFFTEVVLPNTIVVPEPGTLLLAGVGGLAVTMRRRSRRA